jgi:hypothetical protein
MAINMKETGTLVRSMGLAYLFLPPVISTKGSLKRTCLRGRVPIIRKMEISLTENGNREKNMDMVGFSGRMEGEFTENGLMVSYNIFDFISLHDDEG